MFKKWFVMLSIMSLLLAACSSGGKEAGQQPGAQKNIVIATPVASPYLKEAVQKFEAIHPDIHVEIKEYFTAMKAKQDANGQVTQNISLLEVEKYTQSITTQILSGKASDLIATDFLPKDKFIKKQAFANVRELMDSDGSFQKSEYYLVDSGASNEGLYVVPTSFSLTGLVQGNKSLMEQAEIALDDKTWTWDQVSDLSKQLKEKAGQDTYAFLDIDPTYLMMGDLQRYYQRDSASFDSDAFRNAMQQVKTLYDQKAMPIEFGADHSKGLFSFADMSNPTGALVSILNPEMSIYRAPSFTGQTGEIGYEAGEAYAINNKSQVKPEAWKFLSFMLSEEMQDSTELSGFPLNKAAAKKKIQQAREQIEQSAGEGADSTPISFPLPDAKAFDQAEETLKSVMESAVSSSSADLEITNIVMQEFAYYMNGQKTAEEVSQLIQNRVTTYLNE